MGKQTVSGLGLGSGGEAMVAKVTKEEGGFIIGAATTEFTMEEGGTTIERALGMVEVTEE